MYIQSPGSHTWELVHVHEMDSKEVWAWNQCLGPDKAAYAADQSSRNRNGL